MCAAPNSSTSPNSYHSTATQPKNQASPEVAQDETTEQVFSRKDRKAYRAEVLRQRTETSAGNESHKKSKVGQTKQTKTTASKGKRTK